MIREVQVREVGLAPDCGDQWSDQVLHEPRERDANDEGVRQVDQTPSQQELLESAHDTTFLRPRPRCRVTRFWRPGAESVNDHAVHALAWPRRRVSTFFRNPNAGYWSDPARVGDAAVPGVVRIEWTGPEGNRICVKRRNRGRMLND